MSKSGHSMDINTCNVKWAKEEAEKGSFRHPKYTNIDFCILPE